MITPPTDAQARTLAPADPADSLDALAIEYARQRYALRSNDDIEIDDEPALSHADNGRWVAAWLWVPNDQLEVPK